ncbi:MAG: 23S rRNA (adenine(1618)-N(6))-methyltransferase RlmF [Halopseudomonas sp.]|uniref:23S rRNA (adenine(1618)-N(6))-methyltransferase RlmF n=1 Tax=Halopseudomonas sp. TaxID=2901191 RepID=UPI0030015590
MPRKTSPKASTKSGLHPRNRHQGHYDFTALSSANPALRAYLVDSPAGGKTLDFANPDAVKALNGALLKLQYRVREWDIPPGYLCPPVPGRADYLHTLADLLGESHDGKIPTGRKILGLDLGTGANLIYPLIGGHEYGWSFVGSDIDQTALDNAERLLDANPDCAQRISLRLQPRSDQIFHQIIKAGEQYDFTLCNPPFHASAEAARAANQRKWQQLDKQAESRAGTLNFGGQANELHCAGGEAGFLSRMAGESADFGQQVFWFSSLVSNADSLKQLPQQLRELGATDVRVLDMAQGQKRSRLLAWTFLDKKQRRAWRKARWPAASKPA